MAKPSNTQLSRKAWLERALEILSQDGNARIRVRRISESLGVTTGSFYWHFKNRDDFIAALLEYWDEEFTNSIRKVLSNMNGPPEERLLKLAEEIVRLDLSRYDFPMRAWAAQDPKVAEVVHRVYNTRLKTVRGLFAEMGFTGDELETRTRTFVFYQTIQASFRSRDSLAKRLRRVRIRHEILTRR